MFDLSEVFFAKIRDDSCFDTAYFYRSIQKLRYNFVIKDSFQKQAFYEIQYAFLHLFGALSNIVGYGILWRGGGHNK